MAEYMNCEDCGVICEKTGHAQKFCPACQRKRRQDAKREARKANRKCDGYHKGENATIKRPKKKTAGYIAGTGCDRWKSCEYGSENADGGTCNYNFITGHCKIIEKDGVRMVAPTKDCVFFQPKKETKKRVQKAMTIGGKRSKLSRAVLQMDLEGNVIREFESMSAAALALGMGNTGGISSVCAGLQRSAGGYRWKLKEG